ncbi:MAG: FAD-binding oxidoreductase [bacterium]
MLTTHQIERLKSLLHKSTIISSPESLLAYSMDASNLRGNPDLVVVPEDRDEVIRIMKWACREKIPVIPRGAGTGVTGGAVPVFGGVVLSLTRMHRIIDIDRSNMMAEIEPGVITEDFKCEVEKQGLFYPPDPASLKACTIGGNIAENAGGPKAVKYGVTRDYCLGLEVVLSDGRVLNTGSKTLKSVVGYDLTRLMVGAEGTLGIITKAFLKLINKPEATLMMRIFFPTIQKAVSAIMAIFQLGITPSILELMDESSIRCVSAAMDLDFPADKKAMLLLEIDGETGAIRRQSDKIKDLLARQYNVEINEARSEQETEEFFHFRRSISPAIYRLGAKKLNEDICVPRSRLADCFIALQKIAKKYNLNMANFGHAGDGNIHVNILLPDQEKEGKKAPDAVKEIFQMALGLGGSISGEHGIGLTKAPYLNMEIDKEGIKLMKDIKSIFDSSGLLNPGKIF